MAQSLIMYIRTKQHIVWKYYVIEVKQNILSSLYYHLLSKFGQIKMLTTLRFTFAIYRKQHSLPLKYMCIVPSKIEEHYDKQLKENQFVSIERYLLRLLLTALVGVLFEDKKKICFLIKNNELILNNLLIFYVL